VHGSTENVTGDGTAGASLRYETSYSWNSRK
jgi:hypothetical protein